MSEFGLKSCQRNKIISVVKIVFILTNLIIIDRKK